MIEFLQRLAPPGDGRGRGDRSQALAAPSPRFAAPRPLRDGLDMERFDSTRDDAGEVWRREVDDSRPVFATPFDGAPEDGDSSSAGWAAHPRRPASDRMVGAGVDASLVEPADGQADAARRESRVSIAHRPAIDPGSNGVETRMRPSPAVASPALEVLSARAPAGVVHGAHAAPSPGVRGRESSPLSATSLAHRAGGPADEPTVVHVTIGRIEVVAHSAPPPARPRGPVQRQPTVALSDYLRGERRGHR